MAKKQVQTESDANRAAIVQIMAAYGWSKADLATQLDVDVRTVQRWLGGGADVPRIALLAVEHLAHREERKALMAELAAERHKPKAT